MQQSPGVTNLKTVYDTYKINTQVKLRLRLVKSGKKLQIIDYVSK